MSVPSVEVESREFTEEVPEAVEKLHCPSCLGPLVDARAKRCPSCHARIGATARPVAVDGNSGTAARPLILVERELEARIAAETAAGFRERRRAAKIARRIAALPPTIFEADAPAGPQPMTSSVIDLPDAAIHDVGDPEPAAVPEPVIEVIEVVEPVEEQVVEVAEAPEPEPVVVEVIEVEVVEAPEPEPVVVEVVEVEVVEVEPVASAAPIAAANWKRSDSLWTAKVFNSSPGVRQTQKVKWPRGWEPEPNLDDLVDESRP